MPSVSDAVSGAGPAGNRQPDEDGPKQLLSNPTVCMCSSGSRSLLAHVSICPAVVVLVIWVGTKLAKLWPLEPAKGPEQWSNRTRPRHEQNMVFRLCREKRVLMRPCRSGSPKRSWRYLGLRVDQGNWVRSVGRRSLQSIYWTKQWRNVWCFT